MFSFISKFFIWLGLVMIDATLKTNLWIRAQIKICDINFLPAIILRKGDPDSGAVILKINRLEHGVQVLSQTRTSESHLAWISITGDFPVNESVADKKIENQCKIDPDIWVLEIEDPNYNYQMQEPII